MAVADRAIFLDKDGTLVENVPYNVDARLIRLYEDAYEALAQLQAEGYRLIVVSNQAGIARGYFEEKALRVVEETIRTLLSRRSIRLDGFYYCPHAVDGVVKEFAVDCHCQKPKPGMLFKAATEMGIDLSRSWMIGDILNDVEAGNRAGCRSILIDNGNETEWVYNSIRIPFGMASNLKEAAEIILKAEVKQLKT